MVLTPIEAKFGRDRIQVIREYHLEHRFDKWAPVPIDSDGCTQLTQRIQIPVIHLTKPLPLKGLLKSSQSDICSWSQPFHGHLWSEKLKKGKKRNTQHPKAVISWVTIKRTGCSL